MDNCIAMKKWKIQMQTLTYGYQDYLVPDVFRNVMSKLVLGVERIEIPTLC
jgi:hypothetical protein